MSRKQITENDIKNHKKLLKQGKSGIDKIYQNKD